ncbi:MAG TPA: SDR family NAD(P)-dependent oxidoreductase [Caulobacteraceae bacterium]|nr:SDR family NAD(P)-dependent oxidoreductase [Caulobacteraceae bacterium]
MSRLAAITGATGFLGRRLVVALAKAGFSVRALVRRPTPAPDWGGASVETTSGDLADADALARLTDGAEVVVHVAGVVKAASKADFMSVNADGARAVAQAAARAGARMVLVSSLSAREPRLSPYAASKRAGEAAAREALGETLSIVRPPAIYGPGDSATLDLFRAAAFSPVLPIPDAPDARLALVFVDDAAAAIVDLARAARGPGPFTTGGARPEGYSWDEIAGALAGAASRRPHVVRIPPGALLAAGGLADSLQRLTGRPSMFTSGKAQEVLHADWACDPADEPPGERAAPINLTEGFSRTLSWYRRHAWRV